MIWRFELELKYKNLLFWVTWS